MPTSSSVVFLEEAGEAHPNGGRAPSAAAAPLGAAAAAVFRS